MNDLQQYLISFEHKIIMTNREVHIDALAASRRVGHKEENKKEHRKYFYEQFKSTFFIEIIRTYAITL